MRVVLIATAGLALVACNSQHAAARQTVRHELGNPSSVEFRKLRANRKEQIVCGEVRANDKPGTGWRHFVAYVGIERAVVAPSSEPISADAEMGDSMLSGEAARFYGACD
jgi:hypothetical protein